MVLFVQRAQLARRGFQLTPENAADIAALCIRLDGLPLAIELAAARSKIFTPQSLLSRLNKQLDILKGGNRSLPARHQTIRQTILWSYDLLKSDEQEFVLPAIGIRRGIHPRSSRSNLQGQYGGESG